MRKGGSPTLAIGLRINPYEHRCERKLRAALEFALRNTQGLGRRGRRSVNVEPLPGALLARISPPWDSAIWRAMESPRP
jgi:hypothetical protein